MRSVLAGVQQERQEREQQRETRELEERSVGRGIFTLEGEEERNEMEYVK